MTRTRTFACWLLAAPALAIGQNVTAESAVVLDAGSGKLLWSKNADESMYPASTTKIMTALLLMEHSRPSDIIVAPQDVQKVKESSMHLRPGERVKVRDMLYAILLRSANDGCYAVATHLAGSVAGFSEMMNKRAAEIGCTHTHFDNPNGLNDPLHYTSAHDLALMGREAMKYEAFRDIVRTEKTKINRGTNWKDLWMVNHNKVLRRDPTCDGIKTGWTVPAGHCFVGSATRENWRVITVVMKSKRWEDDTEELFNWAFQKYRRQDAVEQGQKVTWKVQNGRSERVDLVAASDAYTLLRKGDRGGVPYVKVDIAQPLLAPISKGQRVGDLVVRDDEGFDQRVPLVSAEDVPLESRSALVVGRGASPPRLWVGAGLLVCAYLYRERTRRRIMKVASQ